jgi:hypothetical protein
MIICPDISRKTNNRQRAGEHILTFDGKRRHASDFESGVRNVRWELGRGLWTIYLFSRGWCRFLNTIY